MKHVIELGPPIRWPQPLGMVWSWDPKARIVSHKLRCLVCGTRSRWWGLTLSVDAGQLAEQLSDCSGLSDKVVARLIEPRKR